MSMNYFNLTVEDYRLTLWQRFRLYFQPMTYHVEFVNDFECYVFGFKVIDGKLVILEHTHENY